MDGSIDSSKLVNTILRNVPGTYVRDYTGNQGYLTICRGYLTMYDRWKDTDKFSTAIPAETLCALPPGNVQASSLYDGARLMRPGWRIEMRRARRLMSDGQARRIEKELRMRVFT